MELLLQGMNAIDQKPPLSEKSWLESRLKVLVEACEGNSSILTVVDKLKAVVKNSS